MTDECATSVDCRRLHTSILINSHFYYSFFHCFSFLLLSCFVRHHTSWLIHFSLLLSFSSITKFTTHQFTSSFHILSRSCIIKYFRLWIRYYSLGWPLSLCFLFLARFCSFQLIKTHKSGMWHEWLVRTSVHRLKTSNTTGDYRISWPWNLMSNLLCGFL